MYSLLAFTLLFFTSLVGSEVLSLNRTYHRFEVGDVSFPYTAVTGNFPLDTGEKEKGDNKKEPPSIFFIAYFKDDEQDRPITFVFPGGPGGACGPEAISGFGPRRLLTPAEGKPRLPPYPLIDNPETLLNWTDLVFIDPPGTGYSELGDDPKIVQRLCSIDGDIVALGDFVQTFIAYFNRWNSPKYLSGSSYGTIRCCGLARYLASCDFSLHGIMLLASVIDFSTIESEHIFSESFLIPTFAATAWYHGRLWPEKSLSEVLDAAKHFSLREYVPKMLQLEPYDKLERDAFYQDLSHLIGLPLDTVRRYQGRFDETLYTTEFFASERKVIGGKDTRHIGELTSIQREGHSDDPSNNDMQGVICAFNHYLQNELETFCPFKTYIDFSGAIRRSWIFSTHDSAGFPQLLQRVRRTLAFNPSMKIFLGGGVYDCRTPFAAAEYSLRHLGLPAAYQKNLQFAYYEAGHWMASDHASLQKMKKDLAPFYGVTENR